MKTIIFSLLALTLFVGCTNEKKEVNESKVKPTVAKVDTLQKNNLSEQDSITATGRQILVFLKAKNYAELAKYFSPDGVLFSPYGYIDVSASKKLNPDDFLDAVNKKWMLTWGSYDGTGDPIKLSVEGYVKKFIYNADYLNAEAVGYDQILKQGNAAVNLKTIYPNQHFIDYHFSGFVQKNNGMDWTSLKLVFEKQDGQYFLVAMVHDQWTV